MVSNRDIDPNILYAQYNNDGWCGCYSKGTAFTTDARGKSGCSVYEKGKQGVTHKCANSTTKNAYMAAENATDCTDHCFGTKYSDNETFTGTSGGYLQERSAQNLVNETRYWKSRGHSAVLLYNIHTNTLNGSLRGSEQSNLLLDKSTQEMYTNRETLKRLDGSIYSLQRQVDISNDNALHLMQYTFVLKVLLVYILILLLLFFMKQRLGKRLPTPYVTGLFGLISLPVIGIFFMNYLSTKSRSDMRWPLRQWAMDRHPGSDEPTSSSSSSSCTPLPEETDLYREQMEVLHEGIQTLQETIQHTHDVCDKEVQADTQNYHSKEEQLEKLYNEHPNLR